MADEEQIEGTLGSNFGRVKVGDEGLTVPLAREDNSLIPLEFFQYACDQKTADEGTTVVAIPDEEGYSGIQSDSVDIDSGDIVTTLVDACKNASSPSNPSAVSGNRWCRCKDLTHSGEDHSEPPGGRGADACNINDLSCFGTYQYVRMDYSLPFDDPIWPDDIIKMRLTVQHIYNERGFQNWYPYGGIWIGCRSYPYQMTHPTDDRYNAWHYWDGNNPWPTIRGGPSLYHPPNGEYYDYDIMRHFGDIPSNLPIRAFMVLISNNSSLYWANYVRSHILYFELCRVSPKSDYLDRIKDAPGDDLASRGESALPSDYDKNDEVPHRY